MRYAKRFFDLFWASLGLLILSPLFLAISLVIKLSDGGTVFFLQERTGLGGRAFRICKFRTMVVDAERSGAQLTIGRDPRVTGIGRWLRKTKLDELPQLLNVLAGEMSLVGPRPEVPRYVALYTAEQRKVLELLPGVTDLASIKYRDESMLLGQVSDPERFYTEIVMAEKIHINIEYSKKSWVWTDFQVILMTIFKLMK